MSRGRRQRTLHLEIAWLVNDAGHPRLGLIVPKFQSNAVARNRLRRQLKEIWRRGGLPHLGPIDIVVRTRSATYTAPSSDLKAEVLGWVQSRTPEP
jgi:ribonuclease P protein component